MTRISSAQLLPNTVSVGRSLANLRAFLRCHLFNDVLPFWQRNAFDTRGGINTCIRDDGSLISRDKWLWSQWRAVWVYAKLYNSIERRPDWLEFAQGVYHFAASHGWSDAADGWVLRLDSRGEVLDSYQSIYIDAFAIYGLCELARASNHDKPLELARRTADAVIKKLRLPHECIPHFPYPVPPRARVHGIPMVFSLKLWELGQLTSEKRYLDAATGLSDEIFQRFYRPDRDVILERIGTDGSEYPPPVGSAVVPGHAIEDMWFQIHIARNRMDRPRIDQAIHLIRRHLELGWDQEYGGLLLAIDADGRSNVAWNFAESKLWWPHTEAMYATLLAYEWCRESWCLDWYWRIHDWAFARYPVIAHGDWRQKLTREGRPWEGTIALPVKDPFHLPRALILCLEVLDRLCADTDTKEGK